MKSMKNMKIDDIMKMDGIMEKLYVGLDIHEKYITGTAMRKDGEIAFGGNFPNTKEAAQSFFSGIPGPQVKIAIEACGLWRGVYTMLTELGYTVVMANPYKTHQIVGAKDIDKVNSEALADLLRTGYLPQVYIPTEDVLLLRDIARHRKRLVDERRRLQCMTKSYLMREGIKYPKNWNKETMEFFRNVNPYTAHFINIIETINEQVKCMKKEIRGIARNSHLAGMLQTTPGIAEFSSLMILGEIGDIKRFRRPKPLVSYAGLCPGIYQSGSKCYSVKDKACNKWLKWIMYECSGRAVKMDTKYRKHPRKYLERFRERASQGVAGHRDSPCILNSGYKGKFTARGHSLDRYLDLIQSLRQDYADTITYLENEIIGPRAAVTISFSSPLEDLSTFTSEVNSCTYPFLFLGFPRYEFDDFRALTGVDLHTGGKLNLELSQDWIRMYLIKGLCGNTVVRFYSVVQHVYDSDAELGGAEHGKLF